MSADNWCRCPKCKSPEQNFREDHDLGVDDTGKFFVDYLGKCQDCGYEIIYKYQEQHPAEVGSDVSATRKVPGMTFDEYWESLPDGELKSPLNARIEVVSRTGTFISEVMMACEVVAKSSRDSAKIIEFPDSDHIPEAFRGKIMKVAAHQTLEVFF